MKEGCGDDPEEWCISVGDMADYCVETNKGRYATKEEVLEQPVVEEVATTEEVTAE